MNASSSSSLVSSLSSIALALFGAASLVGCASADPAATDENASPVEGVTGESDEAQSEVGTTESQGEALSAISCSRHSERGYRSGSEFSLEAVSADGKLVELHTADAYFEMAKAAERSGVQLRIVSGFRSMSEQEYLYGCYLHHSCNGGNLAARPGYSNHQSGHALDLNTSAGGVYSWLENHAAEFGFRRTVAGEPWHWEWWGGGPGGGPCAGGGSPQGGGGGGGGGGSCRSSTLGRSVSQNACVQSRFDSKWYQCDSGRWVDRFSDPSACSSVHPL